MAAMASASAAHNVGPPVACTARRALRCAPRCRAAPPVSRLHPGRAARRRGGAATCTVVVAAAAASESSTDPSPGGGRETAAARAVAAGLLAYEAGKHSDAVQHFTAALGACVVVRRHLRRRCVVTPGHTPLLPPQTRPPPTTRPAPPCTTEPAPSPPWHASTTRRRTCAKRAWLGWASPGEQKTWELTPSSHLPCLCVCVPVPA